MYIWERDNWSTLLHWSSKRLLPSLTRVRKNQGRLAGKAEGLGLAVGADLRAGALVEEAVKTSLIEGEHLDLASVRSSVVRALGMEEGNLPPRERQVDGLVRMLVDARDESHLPLTEQRLKGWHAGLFPSDHPRLMPIVSGDWRHGTAPMQVVSGPPGREVVHFVAPDAKRVPDEVGRFLSWWTGDPEALDGVLRAGVAHFWFVTIHPFADGNGRIGRAIAEMALAQDDDASTRLFGLSAQIESERDRYYDELERAQGGDGDLTSWLLWFNDCVATAIERAERSLDTLLAKARFWQRHAETALSERQTKALNRLMDAGLEGFEGGLTTRKYASLTRTSKATAQRELADLLSKGVLKKRPGGGRSTSYEVIW